MHTDTQLVRLGRASAKHAVNAPLVRASTTLFDTLAAYKQSYSQREFESPRYGRSGTTTTFELQTAMSSLARAETCIATSSGLSAICAVLSAHAEQGKHILLSAGVYGPTRRFCETELLARGVQIGFFIGHEDMRQQLQSNTSLVFIETPASLTMEMLDVRAVCAAAHQKGVPVASDSSWGTPLFFDAHGLGIDISIHAATKFINGHSDVMLGLITGSYESMARVRQQCDINGQHATPDACWLALRGLRTLALRLQRHQASALAVGGWLKKHPKIIRVLFPAMPHDIGHALWQQQFTGAAGPFTVELVSCQEAAFECLINNLQLFGLGTSWGGFESLVMPAIPHALRAQKAQSDKGRLLRLHIGLENVDDLCADLSQALQKI
jgi:cysteine-S-conjugate beta-lyase